MATPSCDYVALELNHPSRCCWGLHGCWDGLSSAGPASSGAMPSAGGRRRLAGHVAVRRPASRLPANSGSRKIVPSPPIRDGRQSAAHAGPIGRQPGGILHEGPAHLCQTARRERRRHRPGGSGSRGARHGPCLGHWRLGQGTIHLCPLEGIRGKRGEGSHAPCGHSPARHRLRTGRRILQPLRPPGGPLPVIPLFARARHCSAGLFDDVAAAIVAPSAMLVPGQLRTRRSQSRRPPLHGVQTRRPAGASCSCRCVRRAASWALPETCHSTLTSIRPCFSNPTCGGPGCRHPERPRIEATLPSWCAVLSRLYRLAAAPKRARAMLSCNEGSGLDKAEVKRTASRRDLTPRARQIQVEPARRGARAAVMRGGKEAPPSHS